MSRMLLGLAAAIAFNLAAAPANAGGCCRPVHGAPAVIYAAPIPEYAPPPIEEPVIPVYRVNHGPYVAGLDVDTAKYPQPLFYQAQPAGAYPYVGGEVYWPSYGYGQSHYRPHVVRARPVPWRRHWSRSSRIWK